MAKKSISFSLKLAVILVLACGKAVAQNSTSFGVWASAGVKHALTDRLVLGLEQEVRTATFDYISDSYFTNIELEYQISKPFEGALNYRWIKNYENEGFFSTSHRWMADLEYKLESGRFKYSLRHRTEYQIKGYGAIDAVYPAPEWRMRGTVECSYYLTQRLRPGLSADLRYLIHDPYNPTYQQVDRIRLSAGVGYRLSSKSELGIDGRYQRYFTGANKEEIVFRIAYQYSFAGS